MGRRCTVCTHPERRRIEKALVSTEKLAGIAERFGTTKSSLCRHRQDHLPAHLAKAQEVEDIGQALDVVQQLKVINAACLEVLAKARASDKHRTMLHAADRIQKQIELQARLLGELQDQQTVNVAVVMDPQWVEIRSRVLGALSPHPEARGAVVGALRELET